MHEGCVVAKTCTVDIETKMQHPPALGWKAKVVLKDNDPHPESKTIWTDSARRRTCGSKSASTQHLSSWSLIKLNIGYINKGAKISLQSSGQGWPAFRK